MTHFHFLIWIEGAPVLGKNSNEEVADFIKTYVTCKIPNPDVSPMLYRRVTTHQYHHHNSYCMRSKSVGVKGKGGTRKVCRFAFPKPVTSEWIIRDVQTSIAGRRNLKSKCQLYDNPRNLDEVNINNYNPAVLTAWEGNMDISFVGEKSSSLAWYITKYMAKSERTHVGETFEQINSTKSVASRLWNIGIRALNHRECGALEAADRLLGYPLFMTDRETVIRWVDINIVRSRRVKPRKVIETMDAESTDIFYEGLIESYPKRPVELNDVCLYDYAKWYDIVKAMLQRKDVVFYKLNPGSYLRKREYGYLINHYRYDPLTKPENYFYSLLVLFQPWRCVTELKNGEETYTASYCSVHAKLPMAAEYHERLTEIAKDTKEMKELIQQKMDEMEKDQENHPVSDNIPRGCDPIEADGAMKDFVNLAANEAHKDLNITEMIAELNRDQKRVFDLVTSTMDSDEILRLYVSGEGGTGKSFLIKTITYWLKQIKGKDSAVTAPTGIAAFNIDGLTLHRLFQLPVEHNKTPKYKELSDAALEVIRDNLKNVDLIIIDEISMVSNITLMYIHLRLTEIFNTTDVENGWFGKKHIIVFGDLLQLPPVREEPVFMKLSKDKIQKFIGSLCSSNLWSNLFKYDELSINMRQKNDSSYREMLSKIRLGYIDTESIQMLDSRKIELLSANIPDRIRELCDYISTLATDVVCLMPINRMCDVLNEAMLDRIPSTEIHLIAEDLIDKPSVKTRVTKILQRWEDDISQTAGLARVIPVKIGAKVMLRRNIDVTVGLVNGTIGEVLSVSESLEKNLIEKVTIKLANGAQYSIERVSIKFEVIDGVYVTRKQFPLCVSYAISFHKSQGLSLKCVVMDCGNSIFSCGQIYVGLSRVTSLDGLHLINFDPYSIHANRLCIDEYNRLRNLYRPDLDDIKIPDTRGPKTRDVIWAVPKGMTDVQIQDDITSDLQENIITGFLNADNTSCYANTVIQYCRYTTTLTEELKNFLNIDVFKSKTTLTLQEVIDRDLAQWKLADIPCDNCPAMTRSVRYSLNSVSKILVIVLALPAVDKKTGHYTCMIRHGRSSWISVDDATIEKRTWPVNAKDSYMFFLLRDSLKHLSVEVFDSRMKKKGTEHLDLNCRDTLLLGR
ncbi:uncharacterized protein [Venturia canescens]|uniref:uncharacterized protein n=1 Tax=Venturia canescens TaxID=32260 RepID=UPI001C9CB900|nr:uncharacterized protein LOC122408523 [Venturia canescens]